ncbi:MAG: TIGR01459 family HAD-type hydrolase [Betaproteobacteria bacterium]|nr:TIGR01459 family HAD-type hydrolase [Betaproteobacteria bacterium]
MPTAADYGGVVPVTGVSALAAAYDGFIVDQWGVLHDGTRPYAGAIECLERLRAAGKRVVVLSNSGKREAENLRLMARIGFPETLFDRFVGAGEDARRAIAARSEPFHRTLGRRCYAFTRDGDRSLIDGIGLEVVDRVETADFLAVIGIDSPQRNLRDYETELRAGISCSLPMICANPDLVRVSPEGTVEAPGVLARRYEALGGAVFYHGKPHAAIYGTCLEALAVASQDRVVAIGDSIEHDVLGASRAGLRSAFVAGGIHAAELVTARGELPDAQRWRDFAAKAVARPDYLLPAFVW